MAAFHAQDGWYFEREANGDVTVFVTDPSTEDGVLRKTTLSVNTWASVVASVCKAGEVLHTFGLAKNLHERPY